MNEVKPEMGLHGLLKNSFFQKRYLACQCAQVCDHLQRLIEMTERAVPSRKTNFKINAQHGKPSPTHLEARLERAIWNEAQKNVGGSHIGDVTIHSFQVPLRAHKRDLPKNQTNSDWIRFDLFGTDKEGFPVVLELKANNHNPVHMIVEAAKYGVAVKKIWPNMVKEWKEVFNNAKIPAPEPPLSKCRLICLAPLQFWELWLKSAEFWSHITDLCRRLSNKGFPVEFASFEFVDGSSQLPTIRNLKPICPLLM